MKPFDVCYKVECMELRHTPPLHGPVDLCQQKTALFEGILTAGGIFEGRKFLRNSAFLCARLPQDDIVLIE